MQSSDVDGFSGFVIKNFNKANSVKIKDHCRFLCKLLHDNLNELNLTEEFYNFIQNEKHTINADETMKLLVFDEDIDEIEVFLTNLSEIQLSHAFHLWYPMNDQAWEGFIFELCKYLSIKEDY
jgi:hypothetical protein